MSDYFKDNGQMTDKGANLVANLKQELEFLFQEDDKVENMSVAELRSLESFMHQMIGNFVTNELTSRNAEVPEVPADKQAPKVKMTNDPVKNLENMVKLLESGDFFSSLIGGNLGDLGDMFKNSTQQVNKFNKKKAK